MRLYNRYLGSLALLFTGTTVLLTLFNQHQLDLYFSIFLIEYLAATLLFAHLHPRAQRLLNFAGYLLFGGFLFIVMKQVFDTLVTAWAV